MPATRSRRPSIALLALEAPRAAGELGMLAAFRPLLAQAPKGDGHPVLVLPGLGASDRSTVPLRSFLRGLGYHVHGWRLGRNEGPRRAVVDGLRERVTALHERHEGRPLSVVGWSLGGIYAREIARRAPEAVRRVITLGSPFRDVPGEESYPAAAARWLYGGEPLRPRPVLSERLTVPSTAVYSRTDGIVPWRASHDGDDAGPLAERVEVVASHCGLGHHPAVLWVVADRLARDPADRTPFRATGPWRALIPR